MATAGVRYSEELKASIVRRYLSGNISFAALARSCGATGKSVKTWVEAAKETSMSGKQTKRTKKRQSTERRSASEKLRLLVLIKSLSESERGELMRREGVRDGDIERWEHEACVGGLSGQKTDDAARMRTLEREKNKAQKRLREAEALLELQKKVHALWEAEDDVTLPS